MKTSGWCAVAPGTAHTKRQHGACRGVCGCEAFGGHVGAQIPAVERDSASGVPQFKAENRYARSTNSDGPDAELVPPAGPRRLVRSRRG